MIKTPLSTAIGGAFWTPGATILGSFAKSLSQLIKDMFKSGEQGFAYDINDLPTLYQDAAGTIPVTSAGQPVGLVLDKSKGLVAGSEVVVNGGFSNGTTGWAVVAPWVVQDGKATATSANASLTQIGGVSIPNKWYIVEFDVVLTSGTLYVAVGGNFSNAVTFTTSGRKRAILRAGAVTTKSVEFYGGFFTGSIDNVSVKELAGNHAYQATSSMRGILRDAPRRIDYDGVDDKLTVNLPAQLTGCTVIRAVPNVGTQILTNQTIPTPYNDSTDHCGLIVINRALTQTETAQITTLFNRLAGV